MGMAWAWLQSWVDRDAHRRDGYSHGEMTVAIFDMKDSDCLGGMTVGRRMTVAGIWDRGNQSKRERMRKAREGIGTGKVAGQSGMSGGPLRKGGRPLRDEWPAIIHRRDRHLSF